MILIVGSQKTATAKYAERHGFGTSMLFTGTETAAVCHGSLADCENLQQHFDKFDQIIWAELSQDEFDTFEEYFYTVFLLRSCKAQGYPVVISDWIDPCNLRQHYKTTNSPDTMLFFGCSHTQGVGLDNQEKNYVQLVGKHFDLEPTNFSKGGSSNYRSFELFKQVEFYSSQRVVFQLTDVSRLKYFINDQPQTQVCEQQLQNINKASYLDVYNDKQLIYQCISEIDWLIKYSRQKKLQLVLFNMGGNNKLSNDIDTENNQFQQTLEYYLLRYPEYVPGLTMKNIDRGSDGYHFGPGSHAIWATAIIKKFEELYK